MSGQGKGLLSAGSQVPSSLRSRGLPRNHNGVPNVAIAGATKEVELIRTVTPRSPTQGLRGTMITRNRYSTERIGEPQTVLVVDDDPLIRSVEVQIVASQGCGHTAGTHAPGLH
jgi:hypothetical protein